MVAWLVCDIKKKIIIVTFCNLHTVEGRYKIEHRVVGWERNILPKSSLGWSYVYMQRSKGAKSEPLWDQQWRRLLIHWPYLLLLRIGFLWYKANTVGHPHFPGLYKKKKPFLHELVAAGRQMEIVLLIVCEPSLLWSYSEILYIISSTLSFRGG